MRTTRLNSSSKISPLLVQLAHQQISFPTHPEYPTLPATLEALEAFLTSHPHPHLLFLLEFPWVYSQLTKIVPLQATDLELYLKNQFQFIYTENCSLGTAVIDVNLTGKVGLFGAIFPEKTKRSLFYTP